MFNSTPEQSIERRASAARRRVTLPTVAVAAVVLASLAATALAAGGALTLGSAPNSMLSKQLVISPQGRTLYALSPETSKHLLCKSGECLKNWPPLTVGSKDTRLKAAGGVVGHLGILRRGNGTLQVTLRGLPLYRYAGDHGKGSANGDGIKSFGGTWHAVTAATGGTAKPTPPITPPMESTPPTYPPY